MYVKVGEKNFLKGIDQEFSLIAQCVCLGWGTKETKNKIVWNKKGKNDFCLTLKNG